MTPNPDTTPPRRLTRSTTDKVVGGVAGGLGAYFGIDPVLFRIGFAVSVFFGGLGVLAYIALLAFLPTDTGEPAALAGRSRATTIAASVGLALVAVLIVSPHAFLLGPGLLGLALLAVLGVLVWRAVGGGAADDPARAIARASIAAVVLAAALGAAAGVALLAALGGGTALAVGAIVAGFALLAAGLLGGPRWLILPAIVLVLPLAVVAAAGIDLHGGVGDRYYRVATAADLRPEYRLGMGRLDLDLRRVHVISGQTDVKVKVGVGEAVVRVPADACVTTDARVGAGLAQLLGRDDRGLDVDVADAAPAEAPSVLHVNADVGAGHLLVERDGGGPGPDGCA